MNTNAMAKVDSAYHLSNSFRKAGLCVKFAPWAPLGKYSAVSYPHLGAKLASASLLRRYCAYFRCSSKAIHRYAVSMSLVIASTNGRISSSFNTHGGTLWKNSVLGQLFG